MRTNVVPYIGSAKVLHSTATTQQSTSTNPRDPISPKQTRPKITGYRTLIPRKDAAAIPIGKLTNTFIEVAPKKHKDNTTTIDPDSFLETVSRIAGIIGKHGKNVPTLRQIEGHSQIFVHPAIQKIQKLIFEKFPGAEAYTPTNVQDYLNNASIVQQQLELESFRRQIEAQFSSTQPVHYTNRSPTTPEGNIIRNKPDLDINIGLESKQRARLVGHSQMYRALSILKNQVTEFKKINNPNASVHGKLLLNETLGFIYVDVQGSTSFPRYIRKAAINSGISPEEVDKQLEIAVNKVIPWTTSVVESAFNEIINNAISSYTQDLTIQKQDLEQIALTGSSSNKKRIQSQIDKINFIIDNIHLLPTEMAGDGFLKLAPKELHPYLGKAAARFQAQKNSTMMEIANKMGIGDVLQDLLNEETVGIRVCFATGTELQQVGASEASFQITSDHVSLIASTLEPHLKQFDKEFSCKGSTNSIIDITKAQDKSTKNEFNINGVLDLPGNLKALGIVFTPASEENMIEINDIINGAIHKAILGTNKYSVVPEREASLQRFFQHTLKTMSIQKKLELMGIQDPQSLSKEHISKLVSQFDHSFQNANFHNLISLEDGFMTLMGTELQVRVIHETIKQEFQNRGLGPIYAQENKQLSISLLQPESNKFEVKSAILTQAAILMKQANYQKDLTSLKAWSRNLVQVFQHSSSSSFIPSISETSLTDIIQEVLTEHKCEVDKPFAKKMGLLQGKVLQKIQFAVAEQVIDAELFKRGFTTQEAMKMKLYNLRDVAQNFFHNFNNVVFDTHDLLTHVNQTIGGMKPAATFMKEAIYQENLRQLQKWSKGIVSSLKNELNIDLSTNLQESQLEGIIHDALTEHGCEIGKPFSDKMDILQATILNKMQPIVAKNIIDTELSSRGFEGREASEMKFYNLRELSQRFLSNSSDNIVNKAKTLLNQVRDRMGGIQTMETIFGDRNEYSVTRTWQLSTHSHLYPNHGLTTPKGLREKELVRV